MRVTTKGRVTIPIKVREKLGIFPGTEVEFIVRGDSAELVIAKWKTGKRISGAEIVARLAGKGTDNLDLTTDEIIALMRGRDEDDC